VGFLLNPGPHGKIVTSTATLWYRQNFITGVVMVLGGSLWLTVAALL
jgi:hypothetical protein